jgi:hypothetical protein
MGKKSDYLAAKFADSALRNATFTGPATVYSALFTVSPSDSTAGTEVTNASTGYTRVATTFCTNGATVTGQSVNTNAVNFVTAAVGYTVVGWAACDTSTVSAGNELYWATVVTTAFAIGDQPVIAIGGIVVTED